MLLHWPNVPTHSTDDCRALRSRMDCLRFGRFAPHSCVKIQLRNSVSKNFLNYRGTQSFPQQNFKQQRVTQFCFSPSIKITTLAAALVFFGNFPVQIPSQIQWLFRGRPIPSLASPLRWQVSPKAGSDAVWSRSLTSSFEMTEQFNVSFRGLPEKSFSRPEHPI